MSKSPYGHPQVDSTSLVRGDDRNSVATVAVLKALATGDERRVTGNKVRVQADGSEWVYNALGDATADTSEQLLIDPTNGTGLWCRAPGMADLRFPCTFATADAAVLATIPDGCRFVVTRGYWENTTAWAGGSSSAIGLSGPSPHNTKGDLLGGSAGELTATLVAGVVLGTVGTDQAAGILLKPADTVKFDRITSVYTSGAGYAHLVVQLLLNTGRIP